MISSTEPRSTSSSIVGPPPAVKPTLPELNLHVDADEEDEEEESHLLAIFSKLKEAKKTLDSSKTKKRSREAVESSFNQFKNESKQLIQRYNRRWNAKQNELINHGNTLKLNLKQLFEKHELQFLECEEKLKKQVELLGENMHTLRKLEDEIYAKNVQQDNTFGQEIQIMKAEVNNRLEEVKDSLKKSQDRITKDDKITKLIKTFLTGL